MVERTHGNVPAVIDLTEHCIGGDLDLVEEDLAERFQTVLGRADGSDRDPGRGEIGDEAGDAAMLRSIGVGATEHRRELALVGLGSPGLLAIHDPRVAMELGFRPQTPEVGPCVRLGHAERPPLVATENGNEVTIDLFRCAVLAQRRRDHTDSLHIG